MAIWKKRHHFIGILERRLHFIGYLREEVRFHKVNLGEGWWSLFIGGWLEIHFMVHALPGWLAIYIKLFDWCGLITLKNDRNVVLSFLILKITSVL